MCAPGPFIQGGPPGCFTHVFYRHARRLRFLGAPMDFLKHFRVQVAVSEVKRSLQCETISEVDRLQIYNGYM
jgi:hypothetical protein